MRQAGDVIVDADHGVTGGGTHTEVLLEEACRVVEICNYSDDVDIWVSVSPDIVAATGGSKCFRLSPGNWRRLSGGWKKHGSKDVSRISMFSEDPATYSIHGML